MSHNSKLSLYLLLQISITIFNIQEVGIFFPCFLLIIL